MPHKDKELKRACDRRYRESKIEEDPLAYAARKAQTQRKYRSRVKEKEGPRDVRKRRRMTKARVAACRLRKRTCAAEVNDVIVLELVDLDRLGERPVKPTLLCQQINKKSISAARRERKRVVSERNRLKTDNARLLRLLRRNRKRELRRRSRDAQQVFFITASFNFCN